MNEQPPHLPTPADSEAWPRTDPARSVDQIRGRTSGERMRETVWEYVGQPVMRRTLEQWHGVRRWMLRLFGARIHPTATISRTVRIHHPWNLTMDEQSVIAPRAILFCLGKIYVGRRARVSQFAHLCAGSHDYTRPEMPLITDPIILEDDVWVAADAFIGPGVTIGHDTIIGARSTVLHSRPPGQICYGDSARHIHTRPRSGSAAYEEPAAGGEPTP